jgi:hypothetical protein
LRVASRYLNVETPRAAVSVSSGLHVNMIQ